MVASVEYDDGVLGTRLAYLRDGPRDDVGPTGVFWLGGFKSDMTGAKAEALAVWARAHRRTSLRFDYSGHGRSQGLFVDGTISLWLEQATHMFLRHTRNRRIIVGSSMGGWLALLLANRLRKEDPVAFRRIAGMVLVAPATDMTRDLMWDRFDRKTREALAEHGVVDIPSDHGEPYPVTLKLIEDGANHLLLSKGLHLPFPVRILQGSLDEDVPPDHAIRTFDKLDCGDITLSFVKDGDHRLSTPPQLAILRETVHLLAERADGVVV